MHHKQQVHQSQSASKDGSFVTADRRSLRFFSLRAKSPSMGVSPTRASRSVPKTGGQRRVARICPQSETEAASE